MNHTFVLPLLLLNGCANRVTLQTGEDGELWAETPEITARARCKDGCEDALRAALSHPQDAEAALAALVGHDALITTAGCHRARGPWRVTLPHPQRQGAHRGGHDAEPLRAGQPCRSVKT